MDIAGKDESKTGVLELGTGKSVVYLYYYPTYRSYAILKKEDSYPCKIGRTNKSDPVTYIINQSSTALPEKPEIGLLIYTDNPVGVEQGIHGLLASAGLRKKDAPGQEWFITNPNQVKAFYEHSKHIL